MSGYALLTDNDGKAILTAGGAPTMGYTMAEDEALRGDVDVLSGTAPSGAAEVAIDATSAEENDIELGSTIKVLFQGPTREFTVVGTVGFGGEKDLGGTTSAYFDVATAQEVLGTPGAFDTIGVAGEDGITQKELAGATQRHHACRHRGRDGCHGLEGERGRRPGRPEDRRA